MTGKILRENGIPVPDMLQKSCTDRDPEFTERYGYPASETWSLDIAFAAWLYEHICIYLKTVANEHEAETGSFVLIRRKDDLVRNKKTYDEQISRSDGRTYIVHDTELKEMKFNDFLDEYCRFIGEYIKENIYEDHFISAMEANEIEYEQTYYIISTFAGIINKFAVKNDAESAEKKKSDAHRYGFPESEVYDLRKSAVKWLHTHYIMYREEASGAINLEFYKFTLPIAEVNEEGAVQITAKTFTQAKIIDHVIRQLEIVLAGLPNVKSENRKGAETALIRNCFDIFARTHGVMWW